MVERTVRQATPADREAVVGFTADTWSDRDVGDYIPDVFDEWVASDGPTQRTVVADIDGTVAGICQVVVLTDHEAWAQGMRVSPDYRGQGVSKLLNDACADWARERGAVVMRNMVFGWNTAGLAASRAAGYEPVTEFRWAHPTPDRNATVDSAYAVTDDAAAGWQFYRTSDTETCLQGLGLDMDESWSLSEITLERLRRAASETALLTLQRESGTCAMAYRVRDYERDTDDGSERWADYGVGAWADPPAADALFSAIRSDAATVGADRIRVLVPETARFVSDAVRAAGAVSDHPDYVLAQDLTGTDGDESS